MTLADPEKPITMRERTSMALAVLIPLVGLGFIVHLIVTFASLAVGEWLISTVGGAYAALSVVIAVYTFIRPRRKKS